MLENQPTRVLQILNHMDYGGIEAVVMNYYRFMDKTQIQFDFAVSEDSQLPQREELEKMGANIYLLPKVSSLFCYIKRLRRIIHENKYQIIHCHMNTLNVFPLFAAWREKVPTRICHNHTTAHLSEGKRSILKYILRPFNKLFATDYFACSDHAGKWMYGKRAVRKKHVYIMANAVDTEKFKMDPEIRESIRTELGFDGKFVVGHIGRFMHQKNHEFLVKIFAEIHNQNPDARLLLIGEGELEKKIRFNVHKLNLDDYVIFFGTTDSTYKLYNAMDVFVLPSFYEGLGIVTVEAQCCGVPVVASEAVPAESIISSGFNYMSLQEPPVNWARKIIQTNKNVLTNRLDWSKYCIQFEVNVLKDYYVTNNEQ